MINKILLATLLLIAFQANAFTITFTGYVSGIILIASPEYNASVSGLLKNAIDWASRSETGSYSREAFNGKKFVIMSASPGSGGGAKGLTHLRAIIEALGGTANKVAATKNY